MLAQVQISEIPWKDGLPIGSYDLAHSQAGYCAEGYGYAFRGGNTVAPLTGRPLARLLASSGSEYKVFAADAETVAAVSAHLRQRNQAERADELDSWLDAKPEPAPEPEPPPATQPGPTEAATLPTSREEIDALSDDAARALADELGVTDKRMKGAKLRAVIASELGLD